MGLSSVSMLNKEPGTRETYRMSMQESLSLIPLPSSPQAKWRRQGGTVQVAVEDVSTQHRKDFFLQ